MARTELLGAEGVFLCDLRLRPKKINKNVEKNAEKFGRLKKKRYLCNRKREQHKTTKQ